VHVSVTPTNDSSRSLMWTYVVNVTSSLTKNWNSIALLTCTEFLKISITIKMKSVPHSRSICHHSHFTAFSKSLAWILWLPIMLVQQSWNKISLKVSMYRTHTLRSLVFARLPSTVTSELKTLLPPKCGGTPVRVSYLQLRPVLLCKDTKCFPHARENNDNKKTRQTLT
jgi:hypothetical protein